MYESICDQMAYVQIPNCHGQRATMSVHMCSADSYLRPVLLRIITCGPPLPTGHMLGIRIQQQPVGAPPAHHCSHIAPSLIHLRVCTSAARLSVLLMHMPFTLAKFTVPGPPLEFEYK